MPAPKVSEAEFIALWQRHGNATLVSQALDMPVETVSKRRVRLVKRGFHLPTRAQPGYEGRSPYTEIGWTFPRELRREVFTGSAIAFSDAHYWPGEPTIAHRALIAVTKSVRPRIVFANGDILDGGSISRHDAFGWADRPSVKQELEVCQERLHEIELAVPNGCELIWNIGNHDIRFERNLCSKVPEYANLNGMRLADHFPAWTMAWSTLLNADQAHPVMVKHRHAGGVHAGYNNTLKGGWTMVTSHTHQLEVKPIGDYRGRRWGVQTGTLADLHGPQFEYHENGPSFQCPGFAVLTFHEGKLLPPELCEIIDGRAIFRGEVVA